MGRGSVAHGRLWVVRGEQRDKNSSEEGEHSKRNAEVQEPAFAEATAGRGRLSSVFLFHNSYGRGGGVGRGRAVGIGLTVGVGVGAVPAWTSNEPTSMRSLRTRENPGPR